MKSLGALNFWRILPYASDERAQPITKRDIQGKFALKNNDYRQVRSLRLTDDTWKALGITAECFGMTRSDYLEQVIRVSTSPSITWEKEPVDEAKTTVIEPATTLPTVATLETLRIPLANSPDS